MSPDSFERLASFNPQPSTGPEKLPADMHENIIQLASKDDQLLRIIQSAENEAEKEQLQQSAKDLMGASYEFSRWPQYFADMQKSLEESEADEATVRSFQQSVHKAWLKSMETDDPAKMDKLDYLYNFEPTYRSLRTNFRGVNKEAFKPLIVDKLRQMPHLAIYDEHDFDEIVDRMDKFNTDSNELELTSEFRHGLVAGSLAGKMLEDRGQDEMLIREYSPREFNSLPEHYKRVLRDDTQHVQAVMFIDYSTLWTFEDPEGKSVIRSKKMEVDEETLKQRLDELPDSVPPIKSNVQGDVATFYIRYVDGRHPGKDEDSPDVPAVKETMEQLRQLDWYLNSDTHAGNFVVEEKDGQRKAYWVDQDILDAIVSKNTYSEEARAEAYKTLHKQYPWNK